MKYAKALAITKRKRPLHSGFRVAFESSDRSFSGRAFFPDDDEEYFETEKQAWAMAKKFAAMSEGTYKNIYVVDKDSNAVKGYEAKMIKNL